MHSSSNIKRKISCPSSCMTLDLQKILLVLSLLVLFIQSLSADETTPIVPSGLTATALSSSQVVISWTDNSTNAEQSGVPTTVGKTGFIIERKISITDTYATVATPTANTTVYTDTGLTPFTTYYYRVLAYNAITNSAYSSEIPTVTFNQITSGKMTLQWKAESGNLRVRVSAPTTGWVAVGFNTKTGKKGANLIIGYVKDGKLFIQDAYGTSVTSHASDVSLEGTDNITNKSGTEADGVTEIVFTIPLDSGDEKDIPLVIGKTYNALLAYGKSDNFTGMHSFVRTIKIKIQ